MNYSTGSASDMASTPEDQTKTAIVLDNNYDPVVNPLPVEGRANGVMGAVMMNTNSIVTHTPESNFAGIDTFVCTNCKATATYVNDEATVSVNVGPNKNGQPVIKDDLAIPRKTLQKKQIIRVIKKNMVKKCIEMFYDLTENQDS